VSSDCHFIVLNNLMLPIVAQWDRYNELHFMQDGGHPHFVLHVCAWLDNYFSSWIGHHRLTRWPPYTGVSQSIAAMLDKTGTMNVWSFCSCSS